MGQNRKLNISETTENVRSEECKTEMCNDLHAAGQPVGCTVEMS